MPRPGDGVSWPNGNAGGSSSASCTTARPCGRPRWCCGELVPEGQEPLIEAIDDVQDELHLMLDELRDVAAQIYPPLLKEAGLVPALR